jgi:intracellular multiplication protein IcmK
MKFKGQNMKHEKKLKLAKLANALNLAVISMVGMSVVGLSNVSYAQTANTNTATNNQAANMQNTPATNPFGNNTGTSTPSATNTSTTTTPTPTVANVPTGAIPVNTAPVQQVQYSQFPSNQYGYPNTDLSRNGNVNAQANTNNIPAPNVAPNSLPMDSGPNMQTLRGVENLSPTQAAYYIVNSDPSRIRELKKDMFDKAKVLNEPAYPLAKPVTTSIVVDMSPGSAPPSIRLSKNMPSSIVLTDATGSPWPISNYQIGPADAFDVKRMDKSATDGGSILSITPNSDNAVGSLVLYLQGTNTTISLQLITGQKVYDSRADVRVQGSGPNARYNSASLPASIDNRLLSFLSDVPAPGAKELVVSSGLLKAWMTRDNKMFIKSVYPLMAPAFENVTRSSDGSYAYKLNPVPVVSIKMQDRFVEVGISGF